jgi:regulator of sigma E protease
VRAWGDIQNSLVLGSGRAANGDPEVVIDLERDGRPLQVKLTPRLAGDEKVRRVGIGPGFELIVQAVAADSPAARAGFQSGDEILTLDGAPMINDSAFRLALEASSGRETRATVRRAGETRELALAPRGPEKSAPFIGLTLRTGFQIAHVSPFTQLADVARWTVRTLRSLVSPHSDIGLDKMSGPVGIARILHSAAEVGILAVLMITILLNVNLAIFNLLPLPVLDGGQMVFATIARLRGRPLPNEVIATAQSVFFVLLLSMIAYVTVFSDVPRIMREYRTDRAAEQKGAPAK